MGKLLPSYKKSLFDELITSIESNTSQYYAFAANPKEYIGAVPPVTDDNYSSMFEYNWNMIFGKKLTEADIMPVIKKNLWVSGTVYDRYDSNSKTMYSRNNYYVIAAPDNDQGAYHVYKCINNANGSPSTVKPSSIGNPTQNYNFITLPDNYEWRYITTISSEIYNKFSTSEYAPIYPNVSIVTTASTSSGVDTVVVANGGSGYTTYNNGFIREVKSSKIVRIDSSASDIPGFYNNSAIYFYNASDASSQLRNIEQYVVNSTGKWVLTDIEFNAQKITPDTTTYNISPQVVFETDGTGSTTALSVVNPSTNSISSIVVLQTGANVSWANAHIRSSYGSGAVLYAIVSPPGGHGKDPAVELNMKGYCIAFNFNDTENGTIVAANSVYNKIGIIKNPHAILQTDGSKGARFSANTFSCLLKANVNHTFTKSETVTGSSSKSRGTVVFANSSQVFMVGDKSFANGEFVSNSSTSNVTSINITTRGDIYTKDLVPLYIQNINNVNRETNQSESFKIIIKI